MSNVSYQTAIELKESGLLHSTPQPGMMFYLGNTLCMLCCIRHGGVGMELQAVGSSEKYYPGKEQLSIIGVFAPTADYILKHFAENGMGDMAVSYSTDGACFISYDSAMEENWRGVASGENMAEAAGALYLELKQNAPGQTFVQPGDAEQE